LHEALRKSPWAFDFFQALRRLECVHADKPRLGRSRRPADDPVRLAQPPSLDFPPSTLATFDADGKAAADATVPPRLEVWFFGLFGPNGPLPLTLTDYAHDRLLHGHDPTFARFADIFHHRLLSLFYRAWADARPTVSFDRPDEDRFAGYVASLFGLGMEPLRNRDAMPDLAKLHYAGLLSAQTRHADGLRAMLADFFRLPVEIEAFIGHWITLPESSRCRLGESPATGTLGLTAVIGERVWDCQHQFRIVMGPLRLADYERLLPGGDSLERLAAVVRNYLGDELGWDLNLILKRDEVPPLQLGVGGRLGWTTWLTDRPLDRDADDLKLAAVA
jgi:type VI secretion system protein ImpH